MPIHNIEPIVDEKSKILILGSFPSIKSREAEFFYGNKRNRFWKLISEILGKETPVTVDEKIRMLKENGVALWDVIKECEIKGSSDASITNAEPNDIESVIANGSIKAIFINGATAMKLYRKFFGNKIDLPVILLPSSSPANAAWSYERLLVKWSEEIKKYLPR